MVVYTRIRPKPRRGNEYWKLDNGANLRSESLKRHLSAKGFRLGDRVYKPKRVKICNRAERGLYYFEQCSKSELATFCLQRGLLLQAVKPKKAEMIAALEEADEGQSFDGFAELPAELKAYIYELHFQSFEPLEMPAQPPITQASRILRKESLPLFYKTCTFSLALMRERGAGPATPLNFLWSTKKFLENIASDFLKMIQRLEISGLDMNGYYFFRLSRKGCGPWFIEGTGTPKTGLMDGGRVFDPATQEQPYGSLLQILEAMEASAASGSKSVQAFVTMLRSSEEQIEEMRKVAATQAYAPLLLAQKACLEHEDDMS